MTSWHKLDPDQVEYSIYRISEALRNALIERLQAQFGLITFAL
jgi:hypothetical protein